MSSIIVKKIYNLGTGPVLLIFVTEEGSYEFPIKRKGDADVTFPLAIESSVPLTLTLGQPPQPLILRCEIASESSVQVTYDFQGKEEDCPVHIEDDLKIEFQVNYVESGGLVIVGTIDMNM